MQVPESITDLRKLKFSKYWRVWKPFMVKYNCQRICELGVFEGCNFDLLTEHKPKLAVAVDIWTDDGNIARRDSGYPREILDKQYQDFKDRMANKPFVQIYRQYTPEAAKHFRNNYFDLVYVDADHTYDGCLKDIEAWYPKVKKGKVLTGDDYRRGYISRTKVRIGVKDAVNHFCDR